MMVSSLPVRSIVDAIGRAADAWSRPSFPLRALTRDAVVERTGYSAPVVDYAFDRLFGALTAEEITAVSEDELGSPAVLDRFVERPGRGRLRALPVGSVCIVSSRTTIGVALVPAVFALCAKCDVLVKDREDRFLSAFFATLAETSPELKERAAARTWHGDGDAVDLAGFDAVVAFGSDRTLETISRSLGLRTRLIAYPSKTSAGYLRRAALQSEAAAEKAANAAARDVLLYEGEGCLSLAVLFVERGARVSPARFCELLSPALEDAAAEFPLAPSVSAAARSAMARELAAFRSAVAGLTASDERTDWLVLLDRSQEEPPLLSARTLVVRSVDEPAEAAAYLRRHRISLEALALAGDGDAAIDFAAELGAARIAPFGSLQAPPLGGFHGGRPRIADFVRWIVDET